MEFQNGPEAAPEEQVQDARQDLKKARQDATFAAQELANAEEWRSFKNEIDDKIAKNENRIAELKIQLKKPGKIFIRVSCETGNLMM